MSHEQKLPKIFHGLLNFGTQSGLLARELRKRGYDALSVTRFDPFGRLTDVELKHGGSLLRKIFRHLWNYWFLFKCFWKFDIFHFYYGNSLAPRQLDLPLYRLFGKKVVMEYLGSDVQSYGLSVQKYRWTNMNQSLSPKEGVQHDRIISKRMENEKNLIDKTLVCAPIYSEFVPGSVVLPLAIDIDAIQFAPLPAFDGTFRIMHAPTDRGFKGTNYIVKAIDQLRGEGFSIHFDLVEGVRHDELMDRYRACHIFIDQIMAGWYGTATIEAMAVGRPVVASIRRDYFQYIDYGNQIPAIHADPDCIVEVLRDLLQLGYDDLTRRSFESRKFVEEHHSVKNVADILISIYGALIPTHK